MRLAPATEPLPDDTPALYSNIAFLIENVPVIIVRHEANRIGQVQYLVRQKDGAQFWAKENQITAQEVKQSEL